MASVFITGSGRRMGRVFALEFAKRGWNVAVHYNGSPDRAEETYREVKNKGVEAVKVQADVRSRSEVEEAFEKAFSELGSVDVLVNNAGIFPPQKSLGDVDEELWNNVLNINLRGEFFAAKSFASKAKEGARIVNIASLGAYEIWKGRLPYHVSKAGAVQLTKALARELAPEISVNAVCPGAIYMPEDPSDVDTSLLHETKIPMQRLGTPKDVFDAVWFFATSSPYITAQTLIVDGGYHDAG